MGVVFGIQKNNLFLRDYKNHPKILPVLKNTLQSLAIGFLLMFCGGNAGAQYMIHIAGNNVPAHTGDSSKAVTASLRCPMSLCRDIKGMLYIGDGGPLGYNNDACIRMIDSFGIITTIAGKPGMPDSAQFFTERIPATAAKLQGVAGVCIDQFGDLLIADGVSTVRKIKLNHDTIIIDTISTVAGMMGTTGSSGDNGAATSARLDKPYDVAVDNANNIYICEKGKHVIRRVGAGSGIITTFAGRYAQGFSGDGGLAINAKLNDPRGICVKGNTLYIADYGNNRVRAVNLSTGIITTVAGNGIGYGGDGGAAVNAQLTQPARVTTDVAGNLYIADVANQRIRKVDAGSGTISTYAGNGNIFTGPDVIGDEGPATAACIVPYGMCFDNCNNLYVGSSMFNVRAVVPVKPTNGILCGVVAAGTENIAATAQIGGLRIFPNPNNGRFTMQLTADRNKAVEVVVTDITGRKIKQITTVANKETELLLNEPAGMYFIQAITDEGRCSSKLIVQ